MSGQYKKMEDTLWMFSCSPLYVAALKELSEFHKLKAKYLRLTSDDASLGKRSEAKILLKLFNEDKPSKKKDPILECKQAMHESYSRWMELEAKYYEWKQKKYKAEDDRAVRKSFAVMKKALQYPYEDMNIADEVSHPWSTVASSTGVLSDASNLELWRMHGTPFYPRALKLLAEFKHLGADLRKVEAKYPDWDLWEDMTEKDEKRILELRKQRQELKAKWCDLEADYYAAEAKKEAQVKKALNVSSLKKGYGSPMRPPMSNGVDIDSGMFPQTGVDSFSKHVGNPERVLRNIDSSQSYAAKEQEDSLGALMIVCIGLGGSNSKATRKSKKAKS